MFGKSIKMPNTMNPEIVKIEDDLKSTGLRHFYSAWSIINFCSDQEHARVHLLTCGKLLSEELDFGDMDEEVAQFFAMDGKVDTLLSKVLEDLRKQLFPKFAISKEEKKIIKYLITMILIGLMIFSIFKMLHRSEPSWIVEIFDNKNFMGNPKITSISGLNYFKGIDNEIFLKIENVSMKFYSCLVVYAEDKYLFELGSDDGSKLFIDNEMIIDNWGVHGNRVVNAERTILPGSYLLHLNYFQGEHSSSLFLRIGKGQDALSTHYKLLKIPERLGNGRYVCN